MHNPLKTWLKFKTFSLKFKTNLTKFEITGIEAPKGVQVAVNFLKVVFNMQSVLKLQQF